MNEKQRGKLRQAQSYLGQASQIISVVVEEEQEKVDNIPENLQNGDRYMAMERALDELEEAVDNISQATENINNAY